MDYSYSIQGREGKGASSLTLANIGTVDVKHFYDPFDSELETLSPVSFISDLQNNFRFSFFSYTWEV